MGGRGYNRSMLGKPGEECGPVQRLPLLDILVILLALAASSETTPVLEGTTRTSVPAPTEAALPEATAGTPLKMLWEGSR